MQDAFPKLWERWDRIDTIQARCLSGGRRSIHVPMALRNRKSRSSSGVVGPGSDVHLRALGRYCCSVELDGTTRVRLVCLPRDGVEPLEGDEVKEKITKFDAVLGDAGSALGDSSVIAAHVDVAADDREAARVDALNMAERALDASGLAEHFRVDEAG